MIFKDVQKYAQSNWGTFLKSITECSRSYSNGVPLVVSDSKIYCFDDISKTIYANNKLCASVDGIDFNENEILFIEYKSGFKQKITKENYKDSEKSICSHSKNVCKYYWDLFFALRDKEKEELISNLKLKALDTYITFDKNIFPLCDDLQTGNLKLRLIVVIDADEVDNMEDALGELSGKKTSSNNYFTKIKQSLSRFMLRPDAFENNYLYDSIDVYSVKEYSFFINT